MTVLNVKWVISNWIADTEWSVESAVSQCNVFSSTAQDYKPDEDPTKFYSEKTGRGPLGGTWTVSLFFCCYNSYWSSPSGLKTIDAVLIAGNYLVYRIFDFSWSCLLQELAQANPLSCPKPWHWQIRKLYLIEYVLVFGSLLHFWKYKIHFNTIFW